MLTPGGNSPSVLHMLAYRALQCSLSSPPLFLPIEHTAPVHTPVSWSSAENCTLEPVVLRRVAAILSILQLPGGGLGALAPNSKEVVDMFCKVNNGKG